MRILISAFSCAPFRGSEPEAGLQAVLAAASEHEVWVITESENLRPLSDFLASHPARDRIHLVGLDAGGIPARIKDRLGLLTFHLYYEVWQRRLAETATKLNSEFDFDVVHHMTLSSYWSRAGLVAVNKPLVWGPLGGGTTSPNSLVAVMGLLGGIGDFARTVTRPLMAWLTGARRTGHLAAVVLTQNPETAERIKLTDRAVVLCHALAGALSLVEPEVAAASNDAAPRIVTAGRLVGWKATALAISAMRFLEHRDATLEVYGDGPERRRLERLSRRFGVSQRVRFHGNVPRSSLLEAIASADALVHPSLHEAGGFVIVEALTFGTPVVALNRGGPPILTSYWPDVPTRHIRASRPRNTAREIAEALDQVIGQRGIFDPTPSRYFVSGLLAAYRQAAEHDRS